MTRGFRRESCVRGVVTSTRKVATVEGTVQKDATGREQAWDGHVRPATWAADKHPPRFSHRVASGAVIVSGADVVIGATGILE